MSTAKVEPERENLSSGQLLATVVLVLFILGAFLATIFLYRQEQKLDQLARQVAQLSASLSSSGGAGQPPVNKPMLQRLAYVNAGLVLNRLADLDTGMNQTLKTKQAELKKKADQLEQQYNAKQITKEQYDAGSLAIAQEFEQVKQQVTAHLNDLLGQVMQQIGRDRNYDLITAEDNVVLYARSGLMDDLTDEVIARLQAQFAPAH